MNSSDAMGKFVLNNHSEYEIIEWSPRDLEEIVDVNYEIFKGMYEAEPYSLAHYQKKLKGKKTKVFVAKNNGRIIGSSMAFNRRGTLYIWIIGVLEKYQRKGIATDFFNRSEYFAKDNGYKSVAIKVSNVSKPMLMLLLSRGYQVTGIEKSKTDSQYNVVCLELRV